MLENTRRMQLPALSAETIHVALCAVLVQLRNSKASQKRFTGSGGADIDRYWAECVEREQSAYDALAAYALKLEKVPTIPGVPAAA